MIKNIKELVKQNIYFRQVLETGQYIQVVIMSIPKGTDIGEEVHMDNDQVLYLVDGEGKVILNGEQMPFEKHDLVLVKAGTIHNFINTGDEDLKIITTYSPPHHPDGTIHKTKEDAKSAKY